MIRHLKIKIASVWTNNPLFKDNMKELEERINNLEIKFSYQDELINELNLIVTDQQIQIEMMAKALQGLLDSQSQGGVNNSSLKDDRPPHY